jgi:endonuclease/exonuclease/phosphatase family metal-dependent hydrolase
VPFLLAGIIMILPYLSGGKVTQVEVKSSPSRFRNGMAIIIVVAITGFSFFNAQRQLSPITEADDRLVLMTYNIQQGVDLFGNKNFEGQLAKIKEINPDIICLQESDATRISGGNSDVVLYFSQKMGYYEYYGPKTVSGTYGTAILSRYPLENTKTVFTYSSRDEIGTSIAEINVQGKNIKIINSHPAGDEKSREEHINMVIHESKTNDYIIAMGDYNFRQDSPYYSEITKVLNDSWLALYPDAVGLIDEDLLNLSFNNRKTSGGKLLGDGKIDMTYRIDHIFLSDSFKIKEAHYLPAPESETDHPLYWAVVSL